MRVQYTLTLDDVDAFSAHSLQRSLDDRVLLAVLRFGIPGLIVALGVTADQGHRVVAILNTFLAVAVYLVVFQGALPMLRRALNRKLVRDLPRSFPAACKLEADPHGLEIEAPGFRRAFPWSAVRRVDETPWHVFLFVDPGLAVIVPKRELDSDPGWRGVLDAARGLRHGA